MSTQRKVRRPNLIRRYTALATAITALAIGAPATEATAAAPLTTVASLPAINALSFDPTVGGVAVAIGPTVIGDVFNGGTTVVVSNTSAVGSVNYSP
jgi:hypothetical protein